MKDTEIGKKDPTVAVATATAGAAAGMVATSSTAIGAAGAGATGFSGYVAGVAILAGHAACEGAAAVALTTVAAGPILGGFVGYLVYRVVKVAIKKNPRQPEAGAKI